MVHNGWHGIYSYITINTMKVMNKMFGSNISDIYVAFGPGNCSNCYEVRADVLSLFQKHYSEEKVKEMFKVKNEEKYLFDMKKAITFDLLDAGVPEKNIYDTGICCFEDTNFSSYRRDGRDDLAKQILSGIMLSGNV